MALGLTNRRHEFGGPVGSLTSSSFTPSADSILTVYAHCENQSDSSAPSWSISDSVGLTWTKQAESSFAGGAYNGTGVVYTAPVGGSPSSMTVTVDPGTQTFYISARIVDVTGTSVSVVQAKAATSGTNSGASDTRAVTLVLDATPDVAGMVVGFYGTIDNSAATPTFPAGYTELSGNSNPSTAACFYDAASASATLSTSDMGTQVYWGTAAGIEFAEASSGVTGTSAQTLAAFTSTATGTTTVFASVVGTPATENGTSHGASQAINMPASIVAGELLIAAVSIDAASTLTTSSTGWVKLDGYNSAAVSGAVFAKVAAGGDTLTVDGGTTQDYAALVWRVENHGVTTPATDITIASTTGTSSTPNPPNCDPAVSNDWLFIEGFSADDDDDTATYWSTGFTALGQQQSASSTSSCLVAAAWQKFIGSSLDPSAMAMAASEEWWAWTLAIAPYSANVTGTSATTNAAFTSSATGVVNVTGTSAQTLAAATSSASGTFTGSGSYFFDDLNQADGAPAGWSTAGGTDWGVVSNKGSTNGSTALKTMAIAHGVDLSGDWEIQATINASTTIGNGGVTLGLADGTGVGYSLFAGNSSHVQIRTTGFAGGGNLTNDARSSRTTQVRMTYTSATNTFRTYHDGALTGTTVDTTNTAMMSGAVNLIVAIQETTAPTNECTVDDIYVADFIGGTYPPVATITGTSGQTLAAFTSSASGSSATGTSATTNAAFTSIAAGSSTTGTSAQTLAAFTSSASGARGAAGTSATANAAFTSTASGSTVTGSSAQTLAAATSTASGTHSITGTSATTLAAFTSSASGQFGTDVTGTSATTLAAFTSTASGSSVTGSSATTNAAATSTASGAHGVAGTSSTTNAAFTSTATGAFGLDPTGTVAATLADFTSAASGSSVVGSAATTLTSATGVASGAHGVAGTASATLAAYTSTASGSSTRGTAAATLADFLAAAGGSSTTGALAQTLAAFTSTATGTAGDVVVIGTATLSVLRSDLRAYVTGSDLRVRVARSDTRLDVEGSEL